MRPYDPTCNQNTVILIRQSTETLFANLVEHLKDKKELKIDQTWLKLSFTEKKEHTSISHTE